MSAADHLAHEQLRLFVDPAEHIASLKASVDRPSYESEADMWESKLDESSSWGLHDSIYEGGVREPIEVHPHPEGGWIQGQGHHRLAAARDIQGATGNPQFVPIDYSPLPRQWNYALGSDPRSAGHLNLGSQEEFGTGSGDSDDYGYDFY